jgi:predicted nucleotidyltransferase
MNSTLATIKNVLQTLPDLELSILVGSQAKKSAKPESDWDIALRWNKNVDVLHAHQQTELLKQKISDATHIHKDKIDTIDMTTARLAMRAVIAEEGIVLKGEDTLAWNHFLTLTWAEMEDYFWRKNHAA